MTAISRREMLVATGGMLASCNSLLAVEPGKLLLGFSTYGMKSLELEQAIPSIGKIGFDAVEIAARPDWNSAPDKLPGQRRRRIVELLDQHQLKLTSLMEHLIPNRGEAAWQLERERLTKVAELGRDLGGNEPPLIQTVLGGGTWEEKRTFFVDRMGQWAELAANLKTVIAIKPHRGGALSQPAEAVWLFEQLDRPAYLKMVYDYSHYAHRGLPLPQTIRMALPFTVHIAVKDAVQTERGVRFQLPGQSGKFDYRPLLRQFYEGGYRGDVSCEVSGMVWGQPGYDPIQAAQTCYDNVSRAFKAAAVPRGSTS